jgi:hypothetical protein
MKRNHGGETKPWIPFKKMKVIFRKIQNNHNALRDDEIEGETQAMPVVGKPFVMTAPPRDMPVGFRHVNTSPVTKIISQFNHKTTFETQSGSTYSVELI